MTRANLDRLRGVVAPEVMDAARKASGLLTAKGIPHAIAGGLAVGAHGYARATADVDFLVGDEAFEHHAGGVVTLRYSIVNIGCVLIDFVSFTDSPQIAIEGIPRAEQTAGLPVVDLATLLHMKLKANRLKDQADVVELLKRGAVEVPAMDRYLADHAPELSERWETAKLKAAQEDG
jgi:hypothetical protein